MKLLDGAELAGYITERQAKQVRGLKQAMHIYPKLAVVFEGDDAAARTYIQKLQAYGADIEVDVDIYDAENGRIEEIVNMLSNDGAVHGVVVPGDGSGAPGAKDVAGLSPESTFDAAVPMAVFWLLAGYAIDLPGKDIAVVGGSTPAGETLLGVLQASGATARVVADNSELTEADIVLVAQAGQGSVEASLLKEGAVVVDASDSGTVLAADIYARPDGAATPEGAGLGGLAIAALFDNVLRAARQAASSTEPA